MVRSLRRLDVSVSVRSPYRRSAPDHLGGLPWNDARGRIERALGALPDLRVVVFEPRGAQESMHEEEEPSGRHA